MATQDQRLNWHSDVGDAKNQHVAVSVPGAQVYTMGDIYWIKNFVNRSAMGEWDHTVFLSILGMGVPAVLIATAIRANFENTQFSGGFIALCITAYLLFFNALFNKHNNEIAELVRKANFDTAQKLMNLLSLTVSIGALIYAVTNMTSSDTLLLVSSVYYGMSATYFLFKLVRIPKDVSKEVEIKYPNCVNRQHDRNPVNVADVKWTIKFSIDASEGGWDHHVTLGIFGCVSMGILVAVAVIADFENWKYATGFVVLCVISLLLFYNALFNKHNGEIQKIVSGLLFDNAQKALIGISLLFAIGAIVYAILGMTSSNKLLLSSGAIQAYSNVYFLFKLVRIPKDIRNECKKRFPDFVVNGQLEISN